VLPPELHFLTPVCTESFVGWGFAHYHTGGAYSAPPDPLAAFRGPTSKGRGRQRREWGRREEGREMKGERMGEERRGDER